MNMDYYILSSYFGCDNCKHDNDGYWDDYCGRCNPDYSPPSQYRPLKGSIFEKAYYDRWNDITEAEFRHFLNK